MGRLLVWLLLGATAVWWGLSPKDALSLDIPENYPRGWLPDAALLFLLCGAAGLLAWHDGGGQRAGLRRFQPAGWLRASAARVVFLSLAYLLLRHAPTGLIGLSEYFDPRGVTTRLAGHFSGDSYRLFFLYFVDAYFWGCLLISGGYFFIQRRDCRAEEDKYLACLRALVTLPLLFTGKRPFWSEAARRGTLTILLKLFFVPYLTSWTIQNVLHVATFAEARQWDFYAVNKALVDGCILLDTLVFAFGYLVESRRLGSEIRSVDPTLLGWLVCLWCYPPFNQYSFVPFDHAWFDISIAADETTRRFCAIVITLLWAIFAWASLALGFKASNLTSRGVVARGPYRFVRHPAYAAKLLVWYIQGVVFGEFTVGILFAFTVIYVLRALTEEWHLMHDPDYLAYQRIVRWRFVPFVL
jgi:protein-S-isoprenylcysteine O-methyltransferase Ste14